MRSLLEMIDYQAALQDAVNWPRVHWLDGTLNLEPGFTFDRKKLEILGQVEAWEASSLFFGGANSVAIRKGQLFAAADDRREGAIRVG